LRMTRPDKGVARRTLVASAVEYKAKVRIPRCGEGEGGRTRKNVRGGWPFRQASCDRTRSCSFPRLQATVGLTA
jgi:hypothetical protein